MTLHFHLFLSPPHPRSLPHSCSSLHLFSHLLEGSPCCWTSVDPFWIFVFLFHRFCPCFLVHPHLHLPPQVASPVPCRDNLAVDVDWSCSSNTWHSCRCNSPTDAANGIVVLVDILHLSAKICTAMLPMLRKLMTCRPWMVTAKL